MHNSNATPPPIVICHKDSKSLPVLMASIEAYVHEDVEVFCSCVEPFCITDTKHRWHLATNKATNFGDAYNNAAWWALGHGHTSVILCNDDVVLRPDTYSLLIEDVNVVIGEGYKVGLVGARSDCVGFARQNIRTKSDDDTWSGIKWQSEYQILKANTVAPLFAWISNIAFHDCPFAPISIGSDTLQCLELKQLGYQNFISRSYVHHVGGISITPSVIGAESHLSKERDYLWLKENRHELWSAIYEVEREPL